MGVRDLGRRLWLLRALRAVGGLALVTQGARHASAAGSCVDSASESLQRSLHYTNPSPNPDQPCAKCSYFTRDAHLTGCGACVILSGPVDAPGHCDSWSGSA